VAALVGAGIALVGFDLAYWLDWPTGPTDVALAGMALALVTAGRIMRTLVLQPAVK
jgi:ABC-type Mn2+/Zn2+ transport system permease subunit